MSDARAEASRRRTEALNAARRSSMRSANVVHREMKRGLITLATIASTASWVGLVGTVPGILGSFVGTTGSQESIAWAVFGRLSNVLVPCALGLIVALVATLCHKYLLAEVEAVDLQMESASLQLVSDLAALPWLPRGLNEAR